MNTKRDNNTLFIKSLDYLKKNRNISFKKAAEALNLDPRDVYNIRDGIKNVPDSLIKKLNHDFPNILHEIDKELREEPKIDFEKEYEVQKKLIVAYESLIDSQRKEIEFMQKELDGVEELKEEVDTLHNALQELVELVNKKFSK